MMMKKFFSLLMLVVAGTILAPTQAATNLPQVSTVAACAEQRVDAAVCGGSAQTGQVYKVPAASDLVRVRKSGAVGSAWGSDDYIFRRFDAVPAGASYEVCTTDVPAGSLVSGAACKAWGWVAKTGTPITNITGIVKLEWTAPTTNAEDGSPLTDLAGFYMYQGTSRTSLVKLATTLGAGARSLELPLPVGTFYFSVSAYNTSGRESQPSTVIEVKVEKAAPVTTPGAPTQFKATVTITVP